MMPFIQPLSQVQLEGKAIVIPVVSTANIGQLAIDLLISSLSLQRVAVFDPQYFIPVVGAREYDQKGVTTPLELYGSPDVDFVFIQQRSPVLKARKDDYIKALLEFIKSANLSSVLLLSGVDLSNRTDSQMMTPTYQIRSQNTPHFTGTPLQNLSNLPIPLYTSPVPQNPLFQQNGGRSETSLNEIPFIPGGGLTRRILSTIATSEWPIPTACFLQFVLEGDNRTDAGLLASVVAKVLGQEIEQWRQPGSWRDGLFGTPHDQTLYG